MHALYHQSLEEGLEILCVFNIVDSHITSENTEHRFSTDYKYAWKSIHIWQWGRKKIEKNTGRAQRPVNVHLHLLQSFILSLSLSSLWCTCTHAHFPTYACTHTHTTRERERKKCPNQQIIHSFLSNCPCGAVQCVMASALCWWLARLYICHFRSIREAREQSKTQVHLSIDLIPLQNSLNITDYLLDQKQCTTTMQSTVYDYDNKD